ncbi:hypothetical protein BC826DRAFT_360976 [Russula brevipes]|nr:hypothetical protein BC826DRAFT_360976 [Russula brevipes]
MQGATPPSPAPVVTPLDDAYVLTCMYALAPPSFSVKVCHFIARRENSILKKKHSDRSHLQVRERKIKDHPGRGRGRGETKLKQHTHTHSSLFRSRSFPLPSSFFPQWRGSRNAQQPTEKKKKLIKNDAPLRDARPLPLRSVTPVDHLRANSQPPPSIKLGRTFFFFLLNRPGSKKRRQKTQSHVYMYRTYNT